jgi:hypothetical protein
LSRFPAICEDKKINITNRTSPYQELKFLKVSPPKDLHQKIVLIRIQIWVEYATTARFPAKDKSMDATSSRTLAVAGIAAGRH